jgi:eukaryotic-like serine/threonine-protein kinase
MSSHAAERLVAGRWTLHTALRRGPVGVIWQAADLAGGGPLAVEELRLPAWLDPAGAEWAALWDRAAAEARAAAALEHPGLVGLRDVVVEDGVVYVATELVDALTLDELVARHGPLPVRRVAQVGLEILDALEAAHAAGLAHLDLRPANVLVAADGRARLAGVGLATLRTDPRLGPEPPGRTSGRTPPERATTAYLAPEQARGDPAGPAADLWALGAILFLAVEGETPFAGDGSEATLAAILGEQPQAPVLAGELSPALTALLTKPAGGRPTVAEARRLLEPLAGGSRPAAGLVGAGHPVGPGVRHPPHPMPGPPEGETSPWRDWAPPGVHIPAHGSRAARNAVDPVVRRVLLIAGGSVLLALLSFVIAVAVTGDPLGLRNQAVATTVATAAPTTTTPPPSTTTPTTVAPLVPPGWAVHTDPATGYQVAVPPGWEVVSDGPRTELRDLVSPFLLRIDWQPDPPADPVTTEQQASQAHAGERSDYRLARLEPAQFKGLSAALLEFTYQDGETWHGLELGIRSPRHHVAMAIYARDRDWGTGWALFEAFKASFVPPA